MNEAILVRDYGMIVITKSRTLLLEELEDMELVAPSSSLKAVV